MLSLSEESGCEVRRCSRTVQRADRPSCARKSEATSAVASVEGEKGTRVGRRARRPTPFRAGAVQRYPELRNSIALISTSLE